MLRWIVRAVVSLAAAGVLLTFVSVDAVLAALGRVSATVWIACLAVYLAGHALTALKLQLLLGTPAVRFASCLRAQYASQASNLGLPGLAGGDFVRAAYLMPAAGMTRVALAAVAARALDVIVLFGVVAIALPFAGAPPAIADLVWQGGWWIAGVAVASVAILLVASQLPILRRAVAMLAPAWAGLRKRRGALAGAIAISLVVQPAFVLINAWLAGAMSVHVELAAWFVAWPLSKLVATLPISLGGLGVREAVLVALLTPFGAPGDGVIASSLVWQSVIVVGGIGGLVVTQLLARSAKSSAAIAASFDRAARPAGKPAKDA